MFTGIVTFVGRVVEWRPGQVGIERFVVVEDAGRLINPMMVEGQIHGGVAQGIANALYEKVVYDATAATY